MSDGYYYRGKTTGFLYEFMSPLINPEGHPVIGGQYSLVEYNDEILVFANHDGSVAMPTAGPTPTEPPNPPVIAIGQVPSPWEQA